MPDIDMPPGAAARNDEPRLSWFKKIAKDPSRPRCSVDGCIKAAVSCGMCSMHYQRTKKKGTPGSAERLKAAKGEPPMTKCGKKQCPAAQKITQYMRHTIATAARKSGELPPNSAYFMGRWASRSVHQARVRANDSGVPFSITRADVKAAMVEVCPITGLTLSYGGNGKIIEASPSLDRIIGERGYVPGNIAVLSFRANRIKSDATLTELLRIVAMLRDAGAQEDASLP